MTSPNRATFSSRFLFFEDVELPKTPLRPITPLERCNAPKKARCSPQVSSLYSNTGREGKLDDSHNLHPFQEREISNSIIQHNQKEFQTPELDGDDLLPDTQGESITQSVSSASLSDSALPDTQGTSNREVVPADAALPFISTVSFEKVASKVLGNTEAQKISVYQLDNEIPASDSFLPDTQLPSIIDSQSSSNQRESSTLSLNDILSTVFATFTEAPEINPQPVFPSLNKLQYNPQPLRDPRDLPRNKLTVKERKRIVVSSNRPDALTRAMRSWIQKTEWLLDPFREDRDCWLHPSPPGAQVGCRGALRAAGKLQRTFTWHDRAGKHSIVLNYGMASKLASHRLTRQQQDGFVNKQWHLSHLCGNWTCLNPVHTTVEPGGINISRNSCFSHRSGCNHVPKCLKELKIPLGVDGQPIDHDLAAQGLIYVPDDGEDFHQTFDGEDKYLLNDGMEDEENDIGAGGMEAALTEEAEYGLKDRSQDGGFSIEVSIAE